MHLGRVHYWEWLGSPDTRIKERLPGESNQLREHFNLLLGETLGSVHQRYNMPTFIKSVQEGPGAISSGRRCLSTSPSRGHPYNKWLFISSPPTVGVWKAKYMPRSITLSLSFLVIFVFHDILCNSHQVIVLSAPFSKAAPFLFVSHIRVSHPWAPLPPVRPYRPTSVVDLLSLDDQWRSASLCNGRSDYLSSLRISCLCKRLQKRRNWSIRHVQIVCVEWDVLYAQNPHTSVHSQESHMYDTFYCFQFGFLTSRPSGGHTWM